MSQSPAQATSSADLVAWLQTQGIALAFSTYRANRLVFVGRSEYNELKLHERLFDRPMGLYVDDSAGGHRLWMASRWQLWRFDNFLAEGQRHEGGDRLYVPAASFTTGDVNAHELVLLPDGRPLFVNTAFSCLATLEAGSSFAPVWHPPFISKLAADDRCHLNGLALVDGVPTWATACGAGDGSAGWREQRTGGGVLLHLPSNRIAAAGLSMPHSPRWHQGKLWLLNSGTGELGWIDGERFAPLCFLPGFARGLAFAGNTAVVGLSKLRSPQFTGLPLEQRLRGSSNPGGCCGLRVVDLATGAILHSLDLPEPIDELFDVVVLPGARQPRALGLQAEDIQCLVKLPGQQQIVTVRPKAPSGQPHQGKTVPVPGLPAPSAGERADSTAGAPAAAEQGHGLANATGSADTGTGAAAVRYQRVFQLTAQTLAPYASLTYPALTPGSPRLAGLTGELLGVSAMAGGTMVGLAIAERIPGTATPDSARLVSLMVDTGHRRQGIGARLLARLQRFLAELGVTEASVRYQSGGGLSPSFEPLLQRLGWSAPQTEFVLMQSSAELLATMGWNKRYPLKPPYEVFPWIEATAQDMAQARASAAAAVLMPPATAAGLEPALSLGLRHNGALVGWLVVHRVDAQTVRYSSLYMAPAHRRRGQGLALVAEACARQQQAGIPRAKAAIQVDNDEFMRVFRRHLQPYLLSVGQARVSRLAASPAALAPALNPDPATDRLPAAGPDTSAHLTR